MREALGLVTDRLWALDPATYTRHALHRGERVWPESNCYVDLWIELLHTAGLRADGGAAVHLAIDVEGDQWTFFKFPSPISTRSTASTSFELNVWRPLVAHVDEQLALGRPSIVEVDALLPARHGGYVAIAPSTSRRRLASRRSIVAANRLGYFHNAGYYELDGRDFDGLFASADSDPRVTPPCIEIVKFPELRDRDRAARSSSRIGRSASGPSREAAAREPVPPLRAAAGRRTGLAGTRPLDDFHRYAFATFRQCGAAFELVRRVPALARRSGESGLEEAAAACDIIATTPRRCSSRLRVS